MVVLNLKQVRARAWSGYTKNTSGWLPRRMTWLEPRAAEDFEKMNEACGHLIEYTDVFRSARYQIECIKNNPHKKRLYAPPTKSGHNFGWSVDVAINETIKNFKESRDNEIRVAGMDRQSLGRWMKRFGWTGIKKESWHFNHLDGHNTTVKKIDALYLQDLTLDNEAVQRALNILLAGKMEPLKIDGMLGPVSGEAGCLADKILNTDDRGVFGAWFRRVLAGATATINEV